MNMISMRHVKKDGTYCTAIEDIAALANHPNGWLMAPEVARCKNFQGDEAEAEKLRDELSRIATSRREDWRMMQ